MIPADDFSRWLNDNDAWDRAFADVRRAEEYPDIRGACASRFGVLVLSNQIAGEFSTDAVRGPRVAP